MRSLGTPFADVMPALPDDKYAALRADIEQAGLIKSIIVDENDNILDGHHRYRACCELGIEIRTEAYRGVGGDGDKRLRIIALNLAERELSKPERKRLDDERKKQGLRLMADGRGLREVARLCGKALSTIQGWRDSEAGDRSGHQMQPVSKTSKSVSNIPNNQSEAANMTADEQKSKALDLLKSGVRITDVSTAIGAHPDTIRRWASSPETPASTRGRGGGHPRKLDDSDVKRLFHDGKSRAEIATELGVSLGTAGDSLKRLGLSSAGKRAQNQLADHISRAAVQADAWSVGADKIAATASISSTEQVDELCKALSRLSKAAATLKVRLNKEAGKKE